MPDTVTLPLWAVVLLGIFAAWAALDRILVPSVRWFVRRRVDRVLAEVRSRLAIEIRPFQLTKRQVLLDRLMYDGRVMAAAQAHAAEQGMPREVAMARVERYAREIVPAFNAYVYFRLGYWLARRAAELLYRVRVGIRDETGLGRVPATATVVFVINHRSNMDYVLVAYLAASRTALSYAVGEWARIWPLQSLVRAMGAFFVRRGSRDALYRAVLERYVQMATEAGVTQAVFPEGRLSRDGRLGGARLGLLDYMLRGFAPTGPRDLVFVPVGINYDRVLEDRTLLRDLEPGAPERGRLGSLATTLAFATRNLLQMARGRWYRFGYACVVFGSPLSLQDWLGERRTDPRALCREDRFMLVEELAGTLMTRVGEAVPVLPVALVAAALLGAGGAARASALRVRCQGLLAEYQRRGASVHVPRADPGYMVEVGLRMLRLRRLIEEVGEEIRVRPEAAAVVGYYAGSLASIPTT